MRCCASACCFSNAAICCCWRPASACLASRSRRICARRSLVMAASCEAAATRWFSSRTLCCVAASDDSSSALADWSWVKFCSRAWSSACEACNCAATCSRVLCSSSSDRRMSSTRSWSRGVLPATSGTGACRGWIGSAFSQRVRAMRLRKRKSMMMSSSVLFMTRAGRTG